MDRLEPLGDGSLDGLVRDGSGGHGFFGGGRGVSGRLKRVIRSIDKMLRERRDHSVHAFNAPPCDVELTEETLCRHQAPGGSSGGEKGGARDHHTTQRLAKPTED